MTRFTRAIERVAFLAMLVGAAMLIIGTTGYWIDRGGIAWDNLERILEHRYGDQWHPWVARIGLALLLIGYVVAYHYDRIVAPTLRAAARLLHWVRTGG